jgi:hypothetical protein
MMSEKSVFLLGAWLLVAPLAFAQSVTGSVTGSVVDTAGAVVAGAKVELINNISKQTREFRSSGTGAFEFTGLIPGAYRVKVGHAGFKPVEQFVTVSAQERVDMHAIRLAIGDVATSIEVQSEVAHVATSSSDRAQNVNQQMITDTLPGRPEDAAGRAGSGQPRFTRLGRQHADHQRRPAGPGGGTARRHCQSGQWRAQHQRLHRAQPGRGE